MEFAPPRCEIGDEKDMDVANDMVIILIDSRREYWK